MHAYWILHGSRKLCKVYSGTNDLGNTRIFKLLYMIKQDLYSYLTSPGTTIVFFFLS